MDGIAIIVNPANPVDSMTVEEIEQIFTGAVTTWKASRNQRAAACETAMRCVFCATACACILAVLLICFFPFFANGLPFFGEVSLWDFLQAKWKPGNNIFDLPMILGKACM